MNKPTFNEEQMLWQKGYNFVAGIDEVGRGCFAGPIVAAAVVFSPETLPPEEILYEINDSKLISQNKRKKLAPVIMKHALQYSIVEVQVPYINKFGIGKAGQLVLRKAAFSLISKLEIRNSKQIQNSNDLNAKRFEHSNLDNSKFASDFDIRASNLHNFFLLVDGFPIRGLAKKRQKAIVKGDRKCLSIAAASIIAKVHRDSLMQTLAKKYIHYGFAIHKGYGTKQHREAIKQFGLSDLHRTSFNLVKYVVA